VTEGPSPSRDVDGAELLDASAVLAWLQNEPGVDQVDAVIERSSIGAANWSEVLQKAWQHGRDGDEVAALLVALGLEVETVTPEIAIEAARMWPQCPDLSLADRLCLAAGKMRGATVWTADRTWVGRSHGVVVRLFR
jgi:ribonuclease VapC